MKHTVRNAILAASTATIGIMGISQQAGAVPVQGVYVDDARCDMVPNQVLSHELGKTGFFPLNEAIDYQVSPATFTVCVPDDGIQNDWIVQMVNLSGQSWTNLFFVADFGMKIGNSDGTMTDLIGAPNVPTDAFLIDAAGMNNNLLSESINNNGIFEPGEFWRFNVSNFSGPPGLPPVPPIIQTPGKFAGSDPIVIPPINTASILAIPVPEPTTVAVLGLLGTALLMRRPRHRN